VANRSDFNSVLPRQIKRMLSMGEARGWITNPRETRKIMINAHKVLKSFKNKRAAREVGPSGDE
jgi:hypothetical protein